MHWDPVALTADATIALAVSYFAFHMASILLGAFGSPRFRLATLLAGMAVACVGWAVFRFLSLEGLAVLIKCLAVLITLSWVGICTLHGVLQACRAESPPQDSPSS